jgi:PAS domain S-box-containing protein
VTDKVRLSEEAQRAERHLASVVESASDIVLSMDTTGRVLTWNTAAARITGMEEHDVQHRQLGELCPDEQRASLTQTLRHAYSAGRTEPVEVALLNGNKTAIPISWVFSAMRDADNKVVGLVAVGRDLTERRKLEAQLWQSEKLASLGVMAGGIAHEIRNPLAVVSSAAQLLVHYNLSPLVQRECCERILPNVQRVAVIIESLLRFARPSDKGAVQPVNLVSAIQEAVSLVANQIRLAKIELHTLYPDQPIIVLGNLALLQQVVTNLLLNAINAMKAKGRRIQLIVETAGKNALVRVIDTGAGISLAHLTTVFDPFFTTMPVGQGTGLGLSISYAIVKHYGGTIEINSAEGKGTEVRVEIPLTDDKEYL